MTVLFLKRVKRRPSGTEMTILFLRRVKRRLPGTEMTVLFLRRVKKEGGSGLEAAFARNGAASA